jgi:hypothetical protein
MELEKRLRPKFPEAVARATAEFRRWIFFLCARVLARQRFEGNMA